MDHLNKLKLYNYTKINDRFYRLTASHVEICEALSWIKDFGFANVVVDSDAPTQLVVQATQHTSPNSAFSFIMEYG